MELWNPSLPFGIPRETPLDTETSATGLPWDRCPPDSHVWGVRHYDARKYSFLRKFGSEETKGKSQIQVRFKNPKTGAPTSEYVYYFNNHDQASGFYAKFKSAAHPGHVVQELIAAGIPYVKQGAFG